MKEYTLEELINRKETPAALADTIKRFLEQAKTKDNTVSRFQSAP